MKGVLRIGTSGIVLPGPKRTFPAEFQSGTRLNYYNALFDTVEINSTFYKLPLPSTFKKWHSEVDDNFRFTCKLPRIITHSRELVYKTSEIETFMEVSSGIGEKKGCLLVQFPASIKANRSKQVEEILRCLTELNHRPKWRICIEFRDKSWYHEDSILNVLEELDVSVVLHDMPNSKTPFHLAGDPVYLRFHGLKGDYQGTYPNEVLASFADMIKSWLLHRDVYVYFNNTIGNAFEDAQLLKRLI